MRKTIIQHNPGLQYLDDFDESKWTEFSLQDFLANAIMEDFLRLLAEAKENQGWLGEGVSSRFNCYGTWVVVVTPYVDDND